MPGEASGEQIPNPSFRCHGCTWTVYQPNLCNEDGVLQRNLKVKWKQEKYGEKRMKARIKFSQSAKVIYNCLTCNVLKENSTERDSA